MNKRTNKLSTLEPLIWDNHMRSERLLSPRAPAWMHNSMIGRRSTNYRRPAIRISLQSDACSTVLWPTHLHKSLATFTNTRIRITISLATRCTAAFILVCSTARTNESPPVCPPCAKLSGRAKLSAHNILSSVKSSSRMSHRSCWGERRVSSMRR